jgi:hypothetical protein
MSPRSWQQSLRQTLLQDPCIETRPSLEGIQPACDGAPPGAVFAGVGLCTRERVSAAMPLDVLGMLLPAERIRRALGAPSLVVLLAGHHARINNLNARKLDLRTRQVTEVLDRLRDQPGLERLTVLRASELHASARHRALVSRLESEAPGADLRYFREEAADIECLRLRHGGLIKVGWTIGGGGSGADETAFDRFYRRWLGGAVGFVYCKAGRVLEDRRPRAAPYLALDPDRRVCLDPDEDVADKLARNTGRASRSTVNGVRKHLRALARDYCDLLAPLRGPLEQRLQAIIDRTFADRLLGRVQAAG